MLRTGICDLRDKRIASRDKTSPRRPFISLRLLAEINSDAPNAAEAFQAIVYDLRLSSGIYRTTWPNRFQDVDEAACELIANLFGNNPIEVQDWAASDSLSSLEWGARLWRNNESVQVIASDLMLQLSEVSRGQEAYIFEPDGAPLQYVRKPFVISLREETPRHYPVNYFLAKRARRGMEEARNVLLAGGRGEGQWKMSLLPLIHPAALAATGMQGQRFQVRQHSVFEALSTPADVVRTMNIFNSAYFSQEQLLNGFRCVFDSLKDGGVWIIGRTNEHPKPRNMTTFFRKTSGGLVIVNKLNGGADVEDLIFRSEVTATNPQTKLRSN